MKGNFFPKVLLNIARSLRKLKAPISPPHFQKRVSGCGMATDQIYGGLLLLLIMYHHLFVNSRKSSLRAPHLTW